MKSKVYIYGGAFNPPTIGHQIILQAVADEAAREEAEVWIVPSGERRDKTIGASRQTRLDLCEALRESVSTDVVIRIEVHELDQADPTETRETVRWFQTQYPDIAFVWVFGSDSVQTMRQWHGGEFLYRQLGMLVLQRPGYPLDRLPPHGRLLSVNMPEISSTLVRKCISEQRQYAHLVPPPVYVLLSDRI